MPRNILFITTDQQRYDSLACNGGLIARTPNIDALAAAGVNYERAYNQNTVCMPARSTMLTGQYPRTHGVIANGVPLPEDAPSVAAYLAERAGYRTALLGKAHFEPGFDPDNSLFEENRRARRGDIGRWRGFDTSIQAMHTALLPGGRPGAHYGYWLQEHHPQHLDSFAPLLQARGGGDTDAPETKNNPIPREWYHTDWVRDHTLAYLDSLRDDERFFVWMSFPDPHHPWDPPAEELHRVNWRDLDLPPGHPGSDEAIRTLLESKPAHWRGVYDGNFRNLEGGPGNYRPARLTHDMIREINAKTHVMNELVDDAVGAVVAKLAQRGWLDDTDIFFTTDHGELQGDFGFLYKGPFHTDALMRLPFIWRPARSAAVDPTVVTDPVGQIDLAPTFCEIAGIPVPDWMQGEPLPVADGSGRERVLCEWDSQLPAYGMHLRTMYRDGWLCTAYEPSTAGVGTGLEEIPLMQQLFGDALTHPIDIQYDGSEGELYNVEDDPYQWYNLWDVPAYKAIREDLVDDLRASLSHDVRFVKVAGPA
jgi:arylsulfatase A-like enzyme